MRAASRVHYALRAVLTTALMLAGSITVAGQGQSPGNPVEVDGTVEVRFEDYDGGTRLRHVLRAADRELDLAFTGEAPTLTTGSRIRARGALQNNNTLLLSSSDPTSVQVVALASPNTFGAQQTLVILVNFQDKVTEPYTVATAQNMTFTTVSDYYLENTYQQTSITGTVVGWFTIAMSSTTCDESGSTVASLAKQAAANAGVNLAAYTRYIYAFPKNACTWWGMGTVGGNPSQAWINGSYALRVVAHELGHNFGDYHSHSMPCDATGCATVEYGDDVDVMGKTGVVGHMNAFQKERLGWLNYGISPTIQTVTTSNDYWIDNYETITGNPKALKIWNPAKSNYYFVETRYRMGFDGNLAGGVTIHSGGTSGNSSYQVDLAPTTSTWDSILDAGQTFSDSAMGLTIQTISTSIDGALLRVIFGGSSTPCVAAAPAVSVAPTSTAMKFNVTVTNNNSSTCAASSFNLSAGVPGGWSASFSASALSPAPGTSASSTLTLSAPAGTTGSYSFTASATDTASGYAGSATGSVVLATTLTVTSSASMTAGNGNNRSLIVAVSITSGTLAVPGAAVSVVITDPRGAATTLSATSAADGTASVRLNLKPRDPSGTYQVQTTATSNGATGSSTTTIVVP